MLRLIQKYRITYLPLVPPILLAMNKVDIAKKYDLSSLHTVICGGAPLTKGSTEEFISWFPGVAIRQCYGLTETMGMGASTDSQEESRHYGTAGFLSPNTEAKIVDPVSGAPLPPNQKGELWLRGPYVMKGYFSNPEATSSTLDSDGWLRTGDLCYIDHEGYIFVVDRLKELIKYKGYQVALAELESLLHSHPDITDVAVIPFPDKEAGLVPMTYIVTKPGSTLSKQCNQLCSSTVNSLYIMGEAYTQLELNIILAQDLKEMHLFDMMQTYCVVWINFEKKLTTQIDRTGGANPTWNDKAIFRVEESFLCCETSAVMMEIYCVGCLRDTLLGIVRVLLSTLLKGYGSIDFSGMSFLALQVRRPSGHPQGILNLGTLILDRVDLHRMNRFIPATAGAVGFRDLMGNLVERRPSFVGKLLSIKPNNVVDAQEQQSRCQDFKSSACKEQGKDQEKQKDGGEMVEKEKKKVVSCYQILMAPKLKRNKVGLRNGAAKIHLSPSDSNICAKEDQDPTLAYNKARVIYA